MVVVLRLDDVDQPMQRPAPILLPCRDAPGYLHGQVLSGERRRHVDPDRVFRQAKQLDRIVRPCQRGGDPAKASQDVLQAAVLGEVLVETDAGSLQQAAKARPERFLRRPGQACLR